MLVNVCMQVRVSISIFCPSMGMVCLCLDPPSVHVYGSVYLRIPSAVDELFRPVSSLRTHTTARAFIALLVTSCTVVEKLAFLGLRELRLFFDLFAIIAFLRITITSCCFSVLGNADLTLIRFWIVAMVHWFLASHFATFCCAPRPDASTAPYAMFRLICNDLCSLEDKKIFKGPLAARWIGTAMSRPYVLGPRLRWCTREATHFQWPTAFQDAQGFLPLEVFGTLALPASTRALEINCAS